MCLIKIFTGFHINLRRNFERKKKLISKFESLDIPSKPEIKDYVRKHTEIPELPVYGKILSDSYWAHWPKRLVESMMPHQSWVNAEELLKVSGEVGFSDPAHLSRVIKRIREGSTIGCRGPGRLQTKVPNSPPVYEYGVRMADILLDMLKEGLVWGPLLPEEVPWRDITLNQMSGKLKPNGKLRPIMNMSSPYKTSDGDTEAPASVNSGIVKEEFPCTMGSSHSFMTSLAKAGWPSEMSKTDWQSGAFKTEIKFSFGCLLLFVFVLFIY